MRGRLLAATAALGGALVVTSFATAEPTTRTASQKHIIRVSMYDMGFKLSKSVVRPGTVIMRTVNDGIVEHDLRFTRVGVGTPMLQPGERATLTVRLGRTGKYPFVCTVPGHAAAGMKGVLIVKK